ncbi:hypothetical protein [Streptomyces acidiscabies]|uniref:Secreted protein n=1 Tax=Streptomyces acidiscabies TaxID=42234 RepID=A0AAP6BD56_9ACTN|nr:hypothetical protein [Streptomyces acidiscabies]MBP5938932.1 hypothetical protein [Streptomyces sp. LBUM 1476]MBZ3910057.1 hypothetical protein [Streptomyces acidiscabies]MDX2962468.1 hypothetical protein [Streptomyces acidiscabies]MDX3020381.1 hypothetical protein [Streptomyces acidiscabies]MDX3789849.1 hypothetical protein [Streptomyces acidiscabies]
MSTRPRSHRSRKKRITLMLAPVAALAVVIPLMNSAGAATPNEVTADCSADSDKLENCEFVDVQFKANTLGPNERVSPVTDNCGNTGTASKTFSVSTSVTRTIQLEEGFTAGSDTKLASSVFEIGIKFSTTEINITRDDKTTGLSFDRSDTVQPDSIAFFMWSAKRTDVSGFLRATYKDAQDGQKVFFAPSEGAATMHVFYPQILKNGTPDGRLWLRNVKCGTPEANGIQKSANSLRVEPGFGEAGGNATDVEIPLSEIAAS